MKAISLTQPWASLIAFGEKRWETRSWSTTYRGEIAIAASAGFGPIGKTGFRLLCMEHPFDKVLARHARGGQVELPLGKIVAVARVVRVVRTEEWKFLWRTEKITAAEHEGSFGGYEPNRFAWELEDVRTLARPVPCKGALSLWDVPSDVEREVRAQLEEVSRG